jgi:parallel beta-helix repeat protein
VYCDNSAPTLTNCILWDDSPDEIYISSGGPPTVKYCDVQGGTGEAWFGVGCIDADPSFVYAAGGDYRLRPGSPCIDAATSDGTPVSDIDGRPRYDDPMTANTGAGPSGHYYDMGAHEFKGWYVNGDPAIGNDAYDGLEPVFNAVSGHGPELTIQAGINDAGDGDFVSVAAWTYTGGGNKNLDFGGKAITLVSEDGAEATVIDCEGAGRGAYFHSGETSKAVFMGFTIRNGSVTGDGGGIFCKSSSSPTITNCTITANTVTGSGGGIDCYTGSPTIRDCTISGNSATYGGGIACVNRSSPTITNCLITGNSTGADGGGIACIANSSPHFVNCTITGNEAQSGGGLNCQNSHPTLTNCILWGDSPDEIYIFSGGPPAVTYCDIQGGTGEAWFGVGCIDENPLFVSGPLHDYYLSQTAAGQGSDSPCVDTGSDTAANLGLDTRTTRTDHVEDAATVDMGYHSPPGGCPEGPPGDVDGNGVVDGLDLTAVLTAWETSPGNPLWNPAADLDCNGVINGLDLTEVISNWTTAGAAAGSAASVTATPDKRGGGHGNVRRGSGNVKKKN